MTSSKAEGPGESETKKILDYQNQLSTWSLLLRGGENINSVETLYSAFWSVIKIFQAVLADLKVGNALNGNTIKKFLDLTLVSTKEIKYRNFSTISNGPFNVLAKPVQNLLLALIELNTLQSQKEDSLTKEMSKYYLCSAKQGAKCIYSQLDNILKEKFELKAKGKRLHSVSTRQILGEKIAKYCLESAQVVEKCYTLGIPKPLEKDNQDNQEDENQSLKKSIDHLVFCRNTLSIPKQSNHIPKMEIVYDPSLETSVQIRLNKHKLDDLMHQAASEKSQGMIDKLKMLEIARTEMDAQLKHAHLQVNPNIDTEPIETEVQQNPHVSHEDVKQLVQDTIERGELLQIESQRLKSIIDAQMDENLENQLDVYNKQTTECIGNALEGLKSILIKGLNQHKLLVEDTKKTQRVITSSLSNYFLGNTKDLGNFNICLKYIEEANSNRKRERDMYTFYEHKKELHSIIKALKERVSLGIL